MITIISASAVFTAVVFVQSGGTITGMTTLLNAQAAFMPKDDRVVVIEDTTELQIDKRCSSSPAAPRRSAGGDHPRTAPPSGEAEQER